MTHFPKGFIVRLNFRSDYKCDWTYVLLLWLFNFFFSPPSSSLRSPGEQVQYKACAGDHCCAVSGLLHHTGIETELIRKPSRWFSCTFVENWYSACSGIDFVSGNTWDPLPRQSPVCRRLQHLRSWRTTLLVGQLLFLLPGQWSITLSVNTYLVTHFSLNVFFNRYIPLLWFCQKLQWGRGYLFHVSSELQISFYLYIWSPLCSSFIFALLLLSSQEEFLCVCRHPVATELHPGRRQCSAVCWNHRGTLVSNSITGLPVKMADMRSKPISFLVVLLMTNQTLNVLLEYFSSMVKQVSWCHPFMFCVLDSNKRYFFGWFWNIYLDSLTPCFSLSFTAVLTSPPSCTSLHLLHSYMSHSSKASLGL